MKQIVFFTAFVSVFLAQQSRAQRCDLEMVPDSLRTVLSGSVDCMARKGDTLYLGGSFVTVGKFTGAFSGLDTAGNPIAQPTWPKVSGTVFCAAPDGSGGWIIGGEFRQVGDSLRSNLARISAAGKLHPWNPGANGNVLALMVRGGRVYAGGSFSQAGGVARNNIAAISLATGKAQSWYPTMNGAVLALDEKGGTIYTGGRFNVVNGSLRGRVAALDSTTGALTPLNVSCNAEVRTLKVYNGTIYLGGAFTSCAGSTRRFIASVDELSGSLRPFNPAADSFVNSIDVAGNRVYAGGAFTHIGGRWLPFITALDTATGISDNLDLKINNPSFATPGACYSVVVSGNRLYAGGRFNAATGNSSVLYRSNILSADLSVSPAALTAWNPTALDTVNCIVPSGHDVYAGGAFGSIGGHVKRYALAAIDLRTGNPLPWNPEFPGSARVRAMVLRDSILYIGGDFTYIGSLPYVPANYRNNIAAVHAATGALLPFNPALNNDVLALAVDSANVYAGGDFQRSSSPTTPVLRLAAFDRVSSARIWQAGANNQVRTLHLTKGTLYAGGDFTAIGGAGRSAIAAINPATGTATSWNTTLTNTFSAPYVSSIVSSGDTLFACGNFSTIGGSAVSDLAGIDRISGATISWNPNPNSGVTLLAADSKYLYATGYFYIVNGQSRNQIARWQLPSLALDSWNIALPGSATGMLAADSEFYLGGYPTYQTYSRFLNGFSRYRDKITTPQPAISTASPLCPGLSATFFANPNFSGGGFSWTVNGTPSGTGPSLSYIPANGDTLGVVVTIPPTGCFTAPSGTDSLIVTLNPVLTPAISISGPASAAPGTPVTVNATVTDAGSNYTIQWQLDGNPAGTSATPLFTFTKGPGVETIGATLFPGMPGCYSQPDAFATAITVADPTRVRRIRGKDVVSVFPNPFAGELSIEGTQAGDRAILHDALGKEVASQRLSGGKQLMIPGSLPPGTYYLRITDPDGATVAGFSLVHSK